MASDKDRPESLLVEEFLEQLSYARVTDAIESIFEELDANNAVLVGEPHRLQGIATAMDALWYLNEVASPFVLLQEIELGLRALIRIAVEEPQLGLCLKAALGRLYEGNEAKIPKKLEEMMFSEYVEVILFGDNWQLFSGPFGRARPLLRTKLSTVNRLRNEVVHFRGKLTVEDYEALVGFRDWLLIRLDIYGSPPSG